MLAGQPAARREDTAATKDIVITCIHCNNIVHCTTISGQNIAELEVASGSEPFGNWLLDAVLSCVDLQPGQRLVLLNSEGSLISELQDEDPDVCVAARMYGDGTIAYVGDVNSEIETCKFVLAFCRRSTLAPFIIGSRYVVKGLKSKPELNGKVGEVVGYQEARIQLRLMDADRTEMALKQDNLEAEVTSEA